MNIREKNQADCGCGSNDSNCCGPKKGKGKLWTKIVFIVVVLAAAAIVTIKLVQKNDSSEQVRNDTIAAQKTGCGDSSGFKTCTKVCDPSKGCCPQSKK